MGRNLGDTLTGGSDQVALIDVADDATTRAFSFDDLDRRTRGFAAQLAVRRGERIGVLGANSAAYVAALFGIMRAGAVAVPINTRFPDALVEYVIDDAALTRVFADAANIARLKPSRHPVPLALAPHGQFEATIPDNTETGLVLYTSGSTGKPKGVELSHESQWAMVERMRDRVAGVTGIVAAPLYHMNGLLVLMMLLAGRGTVALLPRFDARRFLQAVHDHRVAMVTGVPTMLSLMAREQDLLSKLDLSCVQFVQIGSAPLSQTVVEQVSRLFPNARLSNGYGTTEAGAGMFGPHPDGVVVPALSLGYPQPHVAVRLVGGSNPDEGVLEVKTPAAMTRYLNQPEKTAAKRSVDGWISTGDMMRRDHDGFFYFVGRDDDMFKCGGESVYPGEVERVLERDPRIAECCVVPVPDEVRGQMPVAFVVPTAASMLDEEAVKQVALAGAPPYMHPRRVFFLDRMPLAGTNKIDRHDLAQRAKELTAR